MPQKKNRQSKQGHKHSGILAFLKKHRIAIYPVVVLVILGTLTLLRISGTSIGTYYPYLYGTQSKDPNLLYGKPQTIRSDEWLVSTQLAIAQEKNDFKRVNQNMNEGRDMSIIGDAPYLEWSTVFRPQNFMFYVLPLEFAFAFKWWFLLALLLISSYAFFLKIRPKGVLFAVLASITVSFSPFIFWWYQSGTIAAVAYSFLLMYLCMSIIDAKNIAIAGKTFSTRTSQLTRALILSYVLAAFALLIYPPFQIPLAIVVAFFALGYLLQSGKLKPLRVRSLISVLLPLVGALVLSLVIVGAFIVTRKDVIKAITDTAYPGKRIVQSGGFDGKQLLTTYLQPQLQRSNRGAHYIANQSESSNFIVLSVFFLIPGIILSVWLYLKNKRVDWILAMLNLCNLLFLAHLFVPLPALITHATLLHLVPFQRLMIGLGLLGMVSVAYIAKILSEIKAPYKNLRTVFVAYTLIYTTLAIWAGFATRKEFPLFVSSSKFIIALCLLQCIGFLLFFLRKFNLAMLAFATLAVMSVFHIHPLYRGLGPIASTNLSQQLREVSKDSDSLGVVENLYLENLPAISDRQSVTGVEFYPNVDFWSKYTGEENNTAYNRYAHVQLTEDQQKIRLVQPDYFLASVSCQQPLAKEVDILISTKPLSLTCAHAVKTINYPSVVLYVYRLHP